MSRVVQCLAWDPGPTESAWCRASIGKDPMGRPRFEAAGMVESRDPLLLDVIDNMGEDCLVAVETPKGFIFQHARGAQVLETRGVADKIATLARVRGRKVEQLSVQQWRRALCGKGVRGTPGDEHVKRVLEMLVVEMPRRSSVHVRDALGLAVVALHRAGMPAALV